MSKAMNADPITGTALHVLNFMRAEYAKNPFRWWTYREIEDAVCALHGDLDVLAALTSLTLTGHVDAKLPQFGGAVGYRAEAP